MTEIMYEIAEVIYHEAAKIFVNFVFKPYQCNAFVTNLNLRLMEQTSCVTLRTNNQFPTINGVILPSLVLKSDILRKGPYLTQLFNLIHFF